MNTHIASLNRRSSAEPAAEALQHAAEALDRALFAGVDTTSARGTLAAAREALAAEHAAAGQAARAAAAEERRVAQQAEAAAIDAAQEQVVEAIEAIKPAADADPLSEPVVPPMIKLAAQELARARAALERAQTSHREAVAARDALRTRMRPKEAELNKLRARRAAGDEHPVDVATMHVLGMDIEDLSRMLAPLEAAVAATMPNVQQQAIVNAEAALLTAKRRTEVEGMADRVRQLEAHFTAQVKALRLAAAARGMNNLGSIYVSSDALRKVANGAWL
jgi:hypothetical protein